MTKFFWWFVIYFGEKEKKIWKTIITTRTTPGDFRVDTAPEPEVDPGPEAGAMTAGTGVTSSTITKPPHVLYGTPPGPYLYLRQVIFFQKYLPIPPLSFWCNNR